MMRENTAPAKSRKPRLLIVSTTFPRFERDSGPAPFVFELAFNLQNHFQVTVLAPHYEGAAAHEVWQGMEIFRFRYLPEKWEILSDGRGLQNHLRSGGLARLAAVPFLLSELVAGIRLLRRRRFDAINSHWMVPSGLIFTILAGLFKVRHIITVHAADYFLLNRVPLGKSLIVFMAKRAKAMIPVNQDMAQGIRKLWNRAAVTVMPMGFEPGQFRNINEMALAKARKDLPAGKKFILFVGKLSEKKGIGGLLEAVRILDTELKDFQLLIIGRGGMRPSLERLASALKVMHRVKFLGSVPHQEIPAYYRLAEVIAVPSVPDRYGESEGMPLVVLEGLASGKPVVGTSFCSVPEDLKQGGFFEVSEPTPEALAKELKKMLAGTFRADFSKVDNYSWQKVANFYAEVISG